jgi:hypothetical protein
MGAGTSPFWGFAICQLLAEYGAIKGGAGALYPIKDIELNRFAVIL